MRHPIPTSQIRKTLRKLNPFFNTGVKRRPFLLLEVLIALVLVALCAIPLMQPHFTIAKEERQFLLDTQLEFEAHHIYAQVLEQLLEHCYEWNAMNNGTVKPKEINFQFVSKEAYSIASKLAVYDFHKKAHYDYRLLDLEIHFQPTAKGEPREFNYRLLVRRYRES